MNEILEYILYISGVAYWIDFFIGIKRLINKGVNKDGKNQIKKF